MLDVDLEPLVAGRLVVQGSSGAGKSHLVRYLLEQTHGRIQHFIFDPEGEFVTLRSAFDYVVASASGDGDLPADPRSADLLCRQLVQLQASAIFDLNDLEPERRQQFVALFLHRLVNLPKDLWHPTLVVVDEAHEYAPETGQPPSRKPMEILVSKGRKRGYCAIFCTTRLSKLSKSASEVQNFLVGQTGLDVDVKRAGALLGFDKAKREQLPRLEKEFFAFGPGLRAREVTKVRAGAIQTYHPKPGEIRPPTPPASSALADLIAQMAALPPVAAETDDDEAQAPAEAVSERATGDSGTPARPVMRVPHGWVSPAELERRVRTAAAEAEARGRAEGAAAAIAEIRSDLRPHVETIYHRLANGTAPASPPETQQRRPRPPEVDQPTGVRAETSPPRTAKEPPKPPKRAHKEPGRAALPGNLPGSELRILGALDWLEQIGVSPAYNEPVAFLARYSPSSTSYTNPRGALKAKGLIDYPASGMVALTDEGRTLAPTDKRPRTRAALQEAVLSMLDGPEQRILRPLLTVYPGSLTNDELATAAGYSAGSTSYTNPRGHLRSLGLIDYPQSGRVAALGHILFPKGLR